LDILEKALLFGFVRGNNAFLFSPRFFLFLRYPLPEPEGSTDILEKAILV